MNADVVYRSAHPDVLAVLAEHKAAVEDWQKRAEALLAEFGMPGKAFLIGGWLGDRWIAGVEPPAEGEQVPDGWRLRGDGSVMVPDKRRKAGRDAWQRMEALRPPADLRGSLPGMPSQMWQGRAGVFTPALEERSGAVWVIWRDGSPSVDSALWERVPLSRYWAMREAAEAEDGDRS